MRLPSSTTYQLRHSDFLELVPVVGWTAPPIMCSGWLCVSEAQPATSSVILQRTSSRKRDVRTSQSNLDSYHSPPRHFTWDWPSLEMMLALMWQPEASAHRWCTANSMVLHEDKFEVVHYELNKMLLLRELPFQSQLRRICLYETPTGQNNEHPPIGNRLGSYFLTTALGHLKSLRSHQMQEGWQHGCYGTDRGPQWWPSTSP